MARPGSYICSEWDGGGHPGWLITSLRLDTPITMAKKAKELGKTVSWDPGRVLSKMGLPRLKDVISYSDMVLANEEGVMNMIGKSNYEGTAKMLRVLGVKLVVIKRGPRGIYVDSTQGCFRAPALNPPKIIDTTGAGDAFTAGLLSGMLRGHNVRKAVMYAIATATLKTSRLGSHETPTHNEVINFLQKHLRWWD